MAKFRFPPGCHGIITFGVVRKGRRIRRIRMVLDTGALYSLIPRYIARDLGYSLRGAKRRIGVSTASGSIDTPIIKIDSLQVFGKTVRGLDVMVHDMPKNAYVDGIVGINFLSHFRVTMDFKKGYLELR